MSNPLVNTPIIDKNGVATTRNKKAMDSPVKNSRLDSLAVKSKIEKRNVIKCPEGYYPDVKPDDVIEIGAKNPDSYSNSQDIFLNGKRIGYLASFEERQHSKIRGTRLIKNGAIRKVWRTNAQSSEADGLLVSRSLSGSDFSRARAVYSIVDDYNRWEENTKTQQEYADKGGIFFSKTDNQGELIVNGVVVENPKNATVYFRNEPGFLTKKLVVDVGSNPKERFSIDFNNDKRNSHPVLNTITNGGYNSYTFGDDGSLCAMEGNEVLNELQKEALETIEKFTKVIFAANKNGA